MHYTPAGSLLPPASNSMEQELMVRHPIAYPVLMPIAVNSLPLETLLIPRNPEMLRERLLLNDTAHSELPDTAKKKDDHCYGAADWCKSLMHLTKSHLDILLQVDISFWTDLPIPNDFAIRVIALYLNNDFPVLPLFDADLFLQDLSQKRPYFCSRLLVSALLAWACVGTLNQENDSKLTDSFLASLYFCASQSSLLELPLLSRRPSAAESTGPSRIYYVMQHICIATHVHGIGDIRTRRTCVLVS
jgi:hypothetical protein